MSVGIDFGTTNSVVAIAGAGGDGTVARHEPGGSSNFRSVLCFVKGRTNFEGPAITAGPEALAAYLDHGSDCRLIQSVKSMAANPNFASTLIFGRRYTIEALISLVLQGLRTSSERGLAPLGDAAIAGRPVRFAGQFADEDLALKRLSEAFALAGFERIEFVAEPLAAAYKFASRITTPQICVIADFGGGTSDFSLVRFRPEGDRLAMDTLGASGIGIAGDRLDFRIVEHAVCPKLGLGTNYVSMGKILPMPSHYYARFQRWSDLSFLRTAETFRELRTLKRMAEDPDAIGRLIYIIEEELGFDLYRAVSGAKTALSSARQRGARIPAWAGADQRDDHQGRVRRLDRRRPRCDRRAGWQIVRGEQSHPRAGRPCVPDRRHVFRSRDPQFDGGALSGREILRGGRIHLRRRGAGAPWPGAWPGGGLRRLIVANPRLRHLALPRPRDAGATLSLSWHARRSGMRILLVNPPYHSLASLYGVGAQTPLGLLWVGGALIDAGHEVTLLDAEARRLTAATRSRHAAAFAPASL